MQRLTKIGKVAPKSASDVKFSRLGIGFEKLDRGVFEPEKAYDKVAALGVKWVRIQSGWQRTEQQKGVYDFEWLDDIVDNLVKRDLIPWMDIVYGNPLYSEAAKPIFGSVGCPPVETEEEKTAWSNYVTALVSHFKGRVDTFEIWNEPDCPYSWKRPATLVDTTHGTPSGTEYGLFAIETAKAIRAGNPDAYILGFGLGRTRYLDFVSDAMATGLGDYIDSVSYHIYASDNTRRAPYRNALAAVLHSYNPALELVQGESGTQSALAYAGALCKMNWDEEKQYKFLLRMMVTDMATGNKFNSYFSAMDMVEALHGRLDDAKSWKDFGYFGVIGAEFDENGVASGTYKEKPSYYALQTLASLFAEEFEFVKLPYIFSAEEHKYINAPDCMDLTMEAHTFRLADGKNALVYWNNTDLLTTSFTSDATVELMTTETPQLIDLKDGTIYEIPADMVEKKKTTLKLKHIPIKDYPLMLIW